MAATFPRTMAASFQRPAAGAAFGPWFAPDPYDHQLRDQTMVTAPTFPPFKFESRRARIDWRLLHGIDVNAMTRDVDLDTLEKIVNIVAFGDIEAEDTRHLTELNFIKIFRLSQMMIEYLLYVQECLQSSNAWLQQDRQNMDKYIQAARVRLRELEANSKMSKRELRRARKTIKTYELLAVLNDGRSVKGMATAPATTAYAPPSPPPAPQPQPAQKEVSQANAVMDALLRREVAQLADRLSRATLECHALRAERDDLYLMVKELEISTRTRQREPSTDKLGSVSTSQALRQNSEALQMIQGLQDQLTKATVEITKLRNEKSDLADELDRVTGDRRQLQDEKSRLLNELAARPAELVGPARGGGAGESPRVAADNLSSMLIDADRQKAALQEQLDEARAEITALQKQLMKAMKATAFASGGMPPASQAPDDRALKDLEAAKANLERELADLRQTYNEDVRHLQVELEAAQNRATDAERRLVAAQPGGFVKVQEQRQRVEEDEDPRARSDLLAEFEATNERLNQQVLQLKSERTLLANEVDQLRNQLANRPSTPRGDQPIERDWRTEELERLQREYDAMYSRNTELGSILRDRDAQIERLRATIRDLQAELEERNRQIAADAAVGRVKQQIAEYERMGGQHAKTSSFSFAPDQPVPLTTSSTGAAAADAPTPSRPPPSPTDAATPSPQSPVPGTPPAAASPGIPPGAQPPRTEAAELAGPSFAPPSPRQPPELLDPRLGSKWLRRTPRPAPAEAFDIQQSVLRTVAGKQPEQLDMMIVEEIRVITENPYEYEGDDEAVFRAVLPYEVPQRRGVLSVQPHVLADLEAARSLLTDQLLAVLDDEVAQFGLDPASETMSDKAYAASMLELASRRSKLMERFPKEAQERAENLRETLLTHLELQKRRAQQEQAAAQQERIAAEQAQKAARDAQAKAAGAAAEQQRLAAQVQQQRQLAAAAAAAGSGLGGGGGGGSGSEIRPARGAAEAAAAAGAGAHDTGPGGVRSSASMGGFGNVAVPQAPTRRAASGSSSAATSRDGSGMPASQEAPRPAGAAAAAAVVAPYQQQQVGQQLPLPGFPPPRQGSGRSAAAGSEVTEDHLRSMLPPPGAGAGLRYGSDAAGAAGPSSAGSIAAGYGSAAVQPFNADSSRASPVASPLEQSLRRDASGRERQGSATNPAASAPSSHNSSLRSATSGPQAQFVQPQVVQPRQVQPAQQPQLPQPQVVQPRQVQPAQAQQQPPPAQSSRPTSFSSSQPPAEFVVAAPQQATQAAGGYQLVKELPQKKPSLIMGHARPDRATPQGFAAPVAITPTAAAVATTPTGNMNMSIRSVKYQESDFDDEDDVAPLPQPRAVAKVREEDEYALTEDEETQQDMGIADVDDDITPMVAQPRILMRPSSPPRAPQPAAVAPSRLGQQPPRPVAVGASRGWATDEPLQPAPVQLRAPSPRASETIEAADLESIQSFTNNTLSQSLPRRPGAWDSPAGTVRKMAAAPQQPQQPVQQARQLSGTSKQSGGWDETIKSFGATSTEDVQTIQDFVQESFTESIRPIGRGAPPRGGGSAQPQPAAAARAPAGRRNSFTGSDLSDIEYA